MLFEENYYLERIPTYLHTKIKSLLDYNESWKKIEKCSEIYEIIKPPKTLPPLKSPSEYILDRLTEILCTMGNMRDILLESELYDALSTFYTEKLKIYKQPTDDIETNELILKRKNKFCLEFYVFGIPLPEYRWYKNEELIVEQTSSKLFYESYNPEMAGTYYCIAIQTLEDLSTNTRNIETLKSDLVTVETQQERCIIIKMPPTEISRKVGDEDIKLQVIADGFPMPTYEWTHNNKKLENNKNCIKIPTVIEMTGIYRCLIKNGISNKLITSTVKIIDPNFKFPVSLEPVIEKVALVIGNEAYTNQTKLTTPINDAKALKTKLESIGFLVLNANNLTFNGMIHAIAYFKKMCCAGCIALFYYAGHGFEFGEKYLMPINAQDSKNYRMKDSICEHRIFKEILSTKPMLFLTLLDMCLTFPNIEQNPGIFVEQREVYEFDCERNLLRGYSTTTGYMSLEMEKIKHSVYNCILLDNITKKIPINQMLQMINAEVEEIAKSTNNVKIAKQMPSHTQHISKDYYLDVEKKGNPASRAVLEMLQRPQGKMKPNIPLK